MSEPLAGIRVIEMTLSIQGPAAGVFLADMGAEVIKVEPPMGDPGRFRRGTDNVLPAGDMSPQFVACNRGKRSVCMDLTTEAARQAMHALLASADVFLTNYRESALQRLGFGGAQLRAQYPNLIYASANGLGPLGPAADKAMLDGVAVARSGLAGMTGYPDRTPVLPAASIADHAGAMQVALGVMTALLVRERQGVAQRVQTSALGAQLWLAQWELTHTDMTGSRLQRSGPHHPNIPGPYGIYSTADGGAIMFAQPMDEAAWDAFCIFAEVPDLALDYRWHGWHGSTSTADETAQADATQAVRAALRAAFLTRTTAAWEAFLDTQPGLIWERVRQWHEVFDDPQVTANGYVETVVVPGRGPTRIVGNLVSLDRTPGHVKGGPPALGQDTATVLGGVNVDEDTVRRIENQAIEARQRILQQWVDE